MLGQQFLPEQDRPGQNRVAILHKHPACQRAVSGCLPLAVGANTITLGRQERTQWVGVLPRVFSSGARRGFPMHGQPSRLCVFRWRARSHQNDCNDAGAHMLRVMAGIKPGVKLGDSVTGSCRRVGGVIAANLAQQYPNNNKYIVIPAACAATTSGDGIFRRSTREPAVASDWCVLIGLRPTYPTFC